MVIFLCKKLCPVRRLVNGSRVFRLPILHDASPIGQLFSSGRFTSGDTQNQQQHQHQHLIHNKIATENVPDKTLKIAKNGELVKTLLRNYGFTNTHISKIAKVYPRFLSCNPQKTLLPKLEFFRSIGLSPTDLPKIICLDSSIFWRSLEKQLIPGYNYLKSVLSADENVVKMLKRNTRILKNSTEKKIAPNIVTLRDAGAPHSIIVSMLTRSPYTLAQESNKFKESVNKALEMGFNPSRTTFVLAVQVLCDMRDSTWEQRLDVFRRWGLSDDDIQVAFRSHPLFMYLSERKFTETMDFLVKKMGWQPASVARYPPVLFLNLEKRIIPRCKVVKTLMANGLVKKGLSLSAFLLPNEKCFLDRYVKKYQDDVNGLMDIYLGKVDLLEPKLGSTT